mmetsp:Transcript_28824/g.39618  ORF Transcript_28824/g.39618 Transcript_28824/m.39618 type:complete len:218 (+) Transcript_28824:307-960(+)
MSWRGTRCSNRTNTLLPLLPFAATALLALLLLPANLRWVFFSFPIESNGGLAPGDGAAVGASASVSEGDSSAASCRSRASREVLVPGKGPPKLNMASKSVWMLPGPFISVCRVSSNAVAVSRCTMLCGSWIAKWLAAKGPPVSAEKAHTRSSDSTTGMQPKFNTSYIRLELGESPTGMGQKKADWKPASRFLSPRWMASCLSCTNKARDARTRSHEP